ncbi:MAG: sigma54 specific transcriptional regulator with sensor, Fis family, partial [Acidobacteria bacterium]|nr:sigma54 specific transcriptional regulator with sensor, Fis family [Acidobacteriota bacterium]
MSPAPVIPAGLEDQLHFETLISDLSARLVAATDDAFPQTIEAALGEVVQFFGADRGGILGVSSDRRGLRALYGWYSPTLAERIQPDFDFAQHTPWVYRLTVEQGRPFIMERVEDLPPEAERDRATFEGMGTKSTLSIPIAPGPRVEYLISIGALHREVCWPRSYLSRLQLLGEIFANTVERRRSREAIRESEARLDLATRSAGIVPWDIDGSSGQVWVTPEGKEVYGWPRDAEVTLDLFYATVHPDDVAEVRDRVETVLTTRSETRVEYRIMMPGGSVKWIEARARFRPGPEPSPRPHMMGVSIDVTARKQVESERLA